MLKRVRVRQARQLLALRQEADSPWLLELRPVLDGVEDLERYGLTLQDLSLLDPLRTGILSRLMEDSLRQGLLNALHEQVNTSETSS